MYVSVTLHQEHLALALCCWLQHVRCDDCRIKTPWQPSLVPPPSSRCTKRHTHRNVMSWDLLKINFIAAFHALFMFHSNSKAITEIAQSVRGEGRLWRTGWTYIYRSGAAGSVCVCVDVCGVIWLIQLHRAVTSMSVDPMTKSSCSTLKKDISCHHFMPAPDSIHLYFGL